MRTAVSHLYQRLLGVVRMLWREVAKFGAVGAVGWIIDTGVYLYLMNGSLHQGEVWAKGWGTVAASIFTWVANRYWTFRHRKQTRVVREFVLFFIMNAIGLLIAAGCVAFTKYVLEMTSQFAMFVSGSVVGLVLGSIFRYLAYRYWVFNESLDQEEGFEDDHELIGRDPESAGPRERALGLAQELEGAAGFDPRTPLDEAELDRETARGNETD